MTDPDIRISHHTYEGLIAHLQVHAPTLREGKRQKEKGKKTVIYLN